MPRDEDSPAQSAEFLERVPEDVRATFTDAQIAAVEQAFSRRSHAVDIRLSLPFPGGRRYMVLLMGQEKRSAERRRLERLRQPLMTLWNVLTMAGFGALLFFFVIGAVYMLAR